MFKVDPSTNQAPGSASKGSLTERQPEKAKPSSPARATVTSGAAGSGLQDREANRKRSSSEIIAPAIAPEGVPVVAPAITPAIAPVVAPVVAPVISPVVASTSNKSSTSDMTSGWKAPTQNTYKESTAAQIANRDKLKLDLPSASNISLKKPSHENSAWTKQEKINKGILDKAFGTITKTINWYAKPTAKVDSPKKTIGNSDQDGFIQRI